MTKQKVIKPSIIYIGGYGRSGSTLLERILAFHPDILGCGEISSISRTLDQKDTCSCGKSIYECEFWSGVSKPKEGFENEIKTYQQSISRSDKISLVARKYDQKGISLFNKIMNQAGDYKYIVDSSKTTNVTTYRPLNLADHHNVKLIHIVRNGIDVMNSNLTGDNLKIQAGETDTTYKYAFIRTLLSWPIANLACHFFKMRKGKDKYLRIRYEDLTNNPGKTLNRIGKFLDLDFSQVIQAIEENNEIPLTHQISGNRMRSKVPLILRKNDPKRGKVKFYHIFFFWLFNFVLMKIYKY